jgi:hypothetical protein
LFRSGVGIDFSSAVGTMSRRAIIFLLIVAVAAFVLYKITLPNLPSGVQPKGDEQSPIIAYVSLATSMVSLLTAIFGFAKEYWSRKKT